MTPSCALALLNADLFCPVLDCEVHWHIALVWPRVAKLQFLLLLFSIFSASPSTCLHSYSYPICSTEHMLTVPQTFTGGCVRLHSQSLAWSTQEKKVFSIREYYKKTFFKSWRFSLLQIQAHLRAKVQFPDSWPTRVYVDSKDSPWWAWKALEKIEVMRSSTIPMSTQKHVLILQKQFFPKKHRYSSRDVTRM